MSRRSQASLAKLGSVASTYSGSTNLKDFAEAIYHKLTVLGIGAGQLVHCVLSPTVIADPATALADVTQRFTFLAADPTAVPIDRRVIEVPFAFRYAYFLTASSTVDLYLEAEQG